MRKWFAKLARTILVISGFVLIPAHAWADPAPIRVGYGVAAEEQLWLMMASPEAAPHKSKVYSMDATRFTGADKRVQAFEAGALDIATVSANGAIFAAAEGVKFKIIASLSRESRRGFYTRFMVKNDSPIKTVADLKGKVIGINGFAGSGHLWTRIVLRNAGLKESDVTLVPIAFSAQLEALKSGKIDVGMFPQPFEQMVKAQGGYRTVYTSKDAAPFEEELMLLIAKDDYLKKNTATVRAFLSDLVTATRLYNQDPKAARKTLIDARQVRISPDVYLPMTDYYRDPDAAVDVGALEKMQDAQIQNGFQSKRVDLKSIVDMSYLPGAAK